MAPHTEDRMEADHTAGDRILAARERAALSEEEAAAHAGLPLAWYRDLEHDPGEVWSNASLANLRDLGRAIGLSVRQILEGDRAGAPLRTVTPSELAAAIRASVDADGGDVDGWSERAGWDVAPILVDPARLWGAYTPDALRAICAAVGLDWRGALPD